MNSEKSNKVNFNSIVFLVFFIYLCSEASHLWLTIYSVIFPRVEIQKQVSKQSTSNINNSLRNLETFKTQKPIDKYAKLKEYISLYNKELPQRLDDITVLDKMQFIEGGAIKYQYSVDAYLEDTDLIFEKMRISNKESIISSKNSNNFIKYCISNLNFIEYEYISTKSSTTKSFKIFMSEIK